jgi:hypothetical protein
MGWKRRVSLTHIVTAILDGVCARRQAQRPAKLGNRFFRFLTRTRFGLRSVAAGRVFLAFLRYQDTDVTVRDKQVGDLPLRPIDGLWAAEDELRDQRQGKKFLDVALGPFRAPKWWFSLRHRAFSRISPQLSATRYSTRKERRTFRGGALARLDPGAARPRAGIEGLAAERTTGIGPGAAAGHVEGHGTSPASSGGLHVQPTIPNTFQEIDGLNL